MFIRLLQTIVLKGIKGLEFEFYNINLLRILQCLCTFIPPKLNEINKYDFT